MIKKSIRQKTFFFKWASKGMNIFTNIMGVKHLKQFMKVINLTRFMKVINQKAVYGTLDGANTFMLQFFVSKVP